MFSSYIRELTWSPGHSTVLRYILLESVPVRGSFAVHIWGSFPVRGSFLRACTILFDTFTPIIHTKTPENAGENGDFRKWS